MSSPFLFHLFFILPIFRRSDLHSLHVQAYARLQALSYCGRVYLEVVYREEIFRLYEIGCLYKLLI